jgi:WS/DGAT/MGAT family acyltransferase
MQKAARRAMRAPADLVRAVQQLLGNVVRLGSALSTGKVRMPALSAPKTRFNQAVRTADRSVIMTSFPMQGFRAVKNEVPGATLNDVLLTMVGGALRSFLIVNGELPEQSLIGAAPISVRGEDDYRHGNFLAFLTTPLGTDVADPLERLEKVSAAARNSKQFTELSGMKQLTDVMERLPPVLVRAYQRGRAHLGDHVDPLTATYNTSVTNMRGPSKPVYLAGAKVVQIFGLAPFQQWHGLIHAVHSYHDQFNLSVTTTPDVIPDMELYRRCLQQSFAELTATVLQSPAAVLMPMQRAVAAVPAPRVLAGRTAAPALPGTRRPVRLETHPEANRIAV